MIYFAHQESDALFVLLALGHVGSQRNYALWTTRRVSQQRDMLVHPQKLASLRDASIHDFKRRDFPGNQLLDLWRMLRPVLWVDDILHSEFPQFILRIAVYGCICWVAVAVTSTEISNVNASSRVVINASVALFALSQSLIAPQVLDEIGCPPGIEVQQLQIVLGWPVDVPEVRREHAQSLPMASYQWC